MVSHSLLGSTFSFSAIRATKLVLEPLTAGVLFVLLLMIVFL